MDRGGGVFCFLWSRPNSKEKQKNNTVPLRRTETDDRPQGNFYLKTCRLIVPDLYELDFMSLLCLDSDEADFLSTLIYGEHRES